MVGYIGRCYYQFSDRYWLKQWAKAGYSRNLHEIGEISVPYMPIYGTAGKSFVVADLRGVCHIVPYILPSFSYSSRVCVCNKIKIYGTMAHVSSLS